MSKKADLNAGLPFNEAEVKENLQYFKNVTEVCDEMLV
ncbi:ThiJ/PfpI family protein [Bacillus cereus]|nr:ThiJ/PfpI family protein [Bacillus cereus]